MSEVTENKNSDQQLYVGWTPSNRCVPKTEICKVAKCDKNVHILDGIHTVISF